MNYKNKEWLQENYIDKKLSTYDISKLCYINRTTVLYWLKKFNIKIRSPKEAIKLNFKEIKEKRKQTCLKKYGTEYISQNKEIKEKVKKTNIKKDFTTIVNGKTLREWSKDKNLASSRIMYESYKNGIMPWETKSYKSILEIKVQKFLEEIKINFIANKKLPEQLGLIKDFKRPDFLLPHFNLIIECDGEYYHKDKNKDQKRNQLYKSFGYKVLCFSGEEIKNNWNYVKKEILKEITT